MASDWRVLPVPLRKRVCADCGLVSSTAPPPPGFFEGGYSLYAHAPSAAPASIAGSSCTRAGSLQALASAPDSRRRHNLYSMLVAETHRCFWRLATNGRRQRWLGCDPSAEAVAHANAAGCRVWQGTSSSLPADLQADLVVSVNVIEHVDDPLAFLQDLGEPVDS